MEQHTDAFSRSLGRIEGRLELILSRVDTQARDQAEMKDKVSKLTDRVSKVEQKLWYWSGALLVIGAIFTTMKAKIMAILGV